MVLAAHECAEEQNEPVRIWVPMCREIALALITARSERFLDRDADRVVPVMARSEDSGSGSSY